MSTDDTFSTEIRIDASPEIVFPYFTDPERMARWMGTEHQIDPVPGGALIVKISDDDTGVAEFVTIDPPNRLVFTWGWMGSDLMPPGSGRVEVNLIEDDGATLLSFVHRGIPTAEQVGKHAGGWTHFLGRLQVVAAGGELEPDTKQAANR